MRTVRILFLLFAVCMFALSAASLASSVGSLGGSPAQQTAQQTPDVHSYTLRHEGDTLAVYRSGTKVATLNVSFDDLPADEQQLLESGVYVENEEQLLAMLEDYTS